SGVVAVCFSSRRRHTRFSRDWSSDVCSSDLFKLRYAPHFGMFETHAGSDLIAQLEFMADEGFTALEDNELMSRPVPLQERIGARSEERRVGEECRSRWSPCHRTRRASRPMQT